MSANDVATEVKRGRGRPLGSKNAAKTTTEKSVLSGANEFAVSMYRDAFAKVIRAEDKSRVDDAEIANARTVVRKELETERGRLLARLRETEAKLANIDVEARDRAIRATKGKAEFAESGRAELGNIASALRLTVEQVAEIERLYLETRKDSAPTSAAEQPAA